VSRRGKIKKNWGYSGGKGCMYIKDWFKPIFAVCLTWHLPKFLIPVVDIARHPNVICQATPMRATILDFSPTSRLLIYLGPSSSSRYNKCHHIEHFRTWLQTGIHGMCTVRHVVATFVEFHERVLKWGITSPYPRNKFISHRKWGWWNGQMSRLLPLAESKTVQ